MPPVKLCLSNPRVHFLEIFEAGVFTACEPGFPHHAGMDVEKDDVVPGIDDQLVIDFAGTGVLLGARQTPDFLDVRRLVGSDCPSVSRLFVELEESGRRVRQADDFEPGTIEAGGGTGHVRTFDRGSHDIPDLAFGQILLRKRLESHQGRGQGQARDNK